MAEILASQEKNNLEVYPATAERWNDIEALFGPKGAYAGCWCMFWRLNRADFKKMSGEGTKAVLHDMTVKIEGWPIDMWTHKLAGQTLSGYSGYMGIASAFREAGFVKKW